MGQVSAEKPIIAGKQYHIECGPGDLARYLLVAGDPDRIPMIAKHWDSARQIAAHREFTTYTGKYKGVDISAMSSGIGPASTAIVVNEAAALGVDTFIRVGSTGALQEGIECGDVVISTAAVRLDGASESYIMPQYPAVSDYEVLIALIEAAEELGVRYHVGITATTSDFYLGQARPGFRGFWRPELQNLIPTLQKAGVLNFEMECATLLVLCSLYGLRAGAVCAVYASRPRNEFVAGAGEEECIKVANEATRILSEWDAAKERKSKRYFHPKLSSSQ